MEDKNKKKSNLQIFTSVVKDNLLFMMVPSGVICLILGVNTPYHEILTAFGTALVIVGIVGTHMILLLRAAGDSLYVQFNEQNGFRERMKATMDETAKIQEHTAKTLKNMNGKLDKL